MRSKSSIIAICALVATLGSPAIAQRGGQSAAQPQADSTDPVKEMVARLDLERYKSTIEGLTKLGDRRQGTDRNRAAVDWIEAQLKSYGCANVERITYDYQPPPARGGGRGGDSTAAGRGGRGGGRAGQLASGGGRPRGIRTPTGVNNDSLKQPDLKFRALNSQPTTPGAREEVVCTKVGRTPPDEMYIVGGHMDGHGWGEAANDDGSGTALVMELARVFSSPDVQTGAKLKP